ncbi:hybrid sensor histidine kinase/response regulator [Sphingomonas spermidinifaciens]|uniref:hybrid sensor histidine kinase/response regulator n=1 Tax=Sphingomonas spermidinifaciens TaxID=1141889 RepID=UPI001FE7A24D|nr:PAS domain-containing sensor histidine kinase [Sphingomonas spermidinifaciens]
MSELSEETRLRLLLNAVRDYAIYLLEPDGIVASWNPGAERFKGYSAAEIVGQHFSRFYTEEDRAAGLPARALDTAAREGRFEAEGWRVRKDGSRFWTHVVIDAVRGAGGELVGFAKITRDVTERHEAELKLRESEQRFRMLVQGVRDYAIYMLDPDGRVTNWNAGAEAIKGYTADEIVGEHFSRFYTEADRAAGEPERALAATRAEGRFEKEALRVRKDGETFWAHVVIEAIRDEAGELTGFAKVTRDITERKRAEVELEANREALAQGQKLEAVGRLTGGVAHDFNNLLTVIRSSADLLRRPGLSEEKRARYIEAIADTAERAATLTGQLLAFARRQPLQPERFAVADRVCGMIDLIASTTGAAIELDLSIPADLGWVEADPSQFETAILNLVVNARDAMPGGGTLTIAARNFDAVSALALAGPFVAVEVADSGTGIDPELLDRLFEPFFTTKPVNKGTGLGLSQVYGFAKQSGGEIAVASTPSRGARFTLYLPRVADGERHAAKTASVDENAPLPRRRVLLIEDNETVGGFARSLFEELGQNVTLATGGEAGLAAAAAANGGFDLVFTDVIMPGISGIDVARALRERWPALRVVLTSGYSEVLANEGSHGFELVRKPYSVAGIAAMLRRNH